MKLLEDPREFWNSIPNEDSPNWPVICIDFNGVLDQFKGYNGTVEYTPPAYGAREFLQEVRKNFGTVVIFTATIPVEGVVGWFEQYGLDQYVDYITNWKVPAMVYVDDRAVTFSGNFFDTLNTIKTFIPWWSET